MQTAPLFALLLILLFGWLGFIYFNNPTGNLPQITSQIQSISKTYQNNALNFEFQYDSKELTVKEDSEQEFNKRGQGDFRKNFAKFVGYEPAKFLGAAVVLDKENSYEGSPLTIWVFENLDGLEADEWHDQFWYYPFVWGDFTSRRERVEPQNIATISGQIAYWGVVDYAEGQPKFIYQSKDQKMYLFRVIGNEGDKILESFKFLQ